jgi:hypothetical protein
MRGAFSPTEWIEGCQRNEQEQQHRRGPRTAPPQSGLMGGGEPDVAGALAEVENQLVIGHRQLQAVDAVERTVAAVEVND